VSTLSSLGSASGHHLRLHARQGLGGFRALRASKPGHSHFAPAPLHCPPLAVRATLERWEVEDRGGARVAAGGGVGPGRYTLHALPSPAAGLRCGFRVVATTLLPSKLKPHVTL
jgi:hypothetical protein